MLIGNPPGFVETSNVPYLTRFFRAYAVEEVQTIANDKAISAVIANLTSGELRRMVNMDSLLFIITPPTSSLLLSQRASLHSVGARRRSGLRYRNRAATAKSVRDPAALA